MVRETDDCEDPKDSTFSVSSSSTSKDFPDLSSFLQTVGLAYSFLLSSAHFVIGIRLSRKKTCITRAPSFATKSIMQVGGSRMLSLRALTLGTSQSPNDKSVLIKKAQWISTVHANY